MPKVPAQAKPGHIYHFENYVFTNGESKNMYLLMLAVSRSGDYIFRLLTSRQHGRPTHQPCYQGSPYPSFYLHTAGGILPKESWLDLGKQDDYDEAAFDSKLSAGQIHLVGLIGQPLFRAALECVAQADDTTFAQEQALRDLISTLPRQP